MRLLTLFLLLFLISRIDFRISHEQALSEFDGFELQPKFDSLNVDDRNIHFAFINRKKDSLVVFIHGSPGSWNAFIDFFKADSVLKSMDMISIDRPGFGDSDVGKPEKSIEVQARQMHEVLEQFPHTTKIVVGHSLGGPVAARMAMDYKDSYSRIVLVAPSIDPNMEKYEWYRSWIQTRIGKWLVPRDFWVSNEEIIPLKAQLELMLPLWENIRSEVIVIQGTSDSLVPKENADFAKKMLPDSLLTSRMLEGADHFIPWTHASEVMKALY